MVTPPSAAGRARCQRRAVGCPLGLVVHVGADDVVVGQDAVGREGGQQGRHDAGLQCGSLGHVPQSSTAAGPCSGAQSSTASRPPVVVTTGVRRRDSRRAPAADSSMAMPTSHSAGRMLPVASETHPVM